MSRDLTGILLGSAWQLGNLWCLARLLSSWVGRNTSRRRTLLWLVIKVPLLYGLLILVLRGEQVSLVGFSVGVIATLLICLAWYARRGIVLRLRSGSLHDQSRAESRDKAEGRVEGLVMAKPSAHGA